MGEARTKLKVFVVEDDDLLRGQLLELLGTAPDVEVVGSAGSGEEALERIGESRCEVALVDLGLPGMRGVALIGKVAAMASPPLMMAHTVFDDRNSVLDALKAGASSYVLKGGPPADLVEALHELREGGAPMSPRIARAVLRELQATPATEPDLLSPRERQILRMIDQGLTYKEISAELSISPHTVHSHIKNIYERLQAPNKREALAKARTRGLL